MTVEELLAALKAIIDEAGAESMTEEQMDRYEELEGQLKAAQRAEAIQLRQAAYETPVRNDAGVHTGVAPKDDTLERAFDAYIRTGIPNQDIVELRAQSEGTSSEGGYMVPEGFREKLIERMKAFGGVANVVETITTATGNALPWPTVDDTANLGEIVAEGGTFASGADLVFGTASLGAYKYMAGGASNLPLRVSVELLQDAAFDVQGLVSRKLGERIARIQAVHVVSGTGTAQPLGISTDLTGVEPAAGSIEYDDLINWIHSVDPAYRESGCRWAFNDASLATIKKIRDDNGNLIWRPDTADMATDAGGGTLLGYPVTIDQAFPDFLAAAGAGVNWGVFGDLSEGYVIRRVKDVQLIVNPWTRAANGQVEYTAWSRMDATQQNVNAYTALAGFTA